MTTIRLAMYSAIASRQTEIATLRAIGFGGVAIVVSVMSRSLTRSRRRANQDLRHR